MKEKTLMKKRRRLVFRTTMLAVMVGLVIFAVVSNSKDGNSAVVAVGEQAPDFQLERFGSNGEVMKLSDLQGQGVMINFWATYCGPCKDEMPYMEELYPKYKKKGVEILAVNLDSTELVVERFINDYDLTFPVLQDKRGQVMDRYNIGPIPSTIFVNADGEIVEKVIGPLSLSKLEDYLKQITPTD